MIRKFSFCLAALLVASPALAQSVIVSESQLRTQPLSPTLGDTGSLAIISPELAESLIEVPVIDALPPSGDVLPSLGEVETLAVVTPAQAEEMIEIPTFVPSPVSQESGTFVLTSESETSVIDTLPRIEPALAAIVLTEPLTVAADAPPAEEDVSLYVVGDGTILPASEWGAADSEACKASGGVELPLPGGRIACFKI